MKVKVELYKNIKYIERFKYNNLGQQIALLDTPIEKEMEVCKEFLICESDSIRLDDDFEFSVSEIEDFRFKDLADSDYSRIVAFVDGEEILNKELKKETE